MTDGLAGPSLPLEGTTIGIASKSGQNGQIPIGQPVSKRSPRRSRRSFPTLYWRGTTLCARFPRISEDGTRTTRAERNAGTPNRWTPNLWTPTWVPPPWPLPLAEDGALPPAPKRPSMTIAESQKPRSLMAWSPAGPTPGTARPAQMALGAANTSAFSIAGQPFHSMITHMLTRGSPHVLLAKMMTTRGLPTARLPSSTPTLYERA